MRRLSPLVALFFVCVLALAGPKESDDWAPAWGPNNRIAFVSNRDGDSEIYVMDLSGGAVQKLTNNSASDLRPSWSPDGQKLAFYSSRDGNFEIYIMNGDGSNVQRLTENPAMDLDPAWSPDGKKIVFESLRDGWSDLYVIHLDTRAITRLTKDIWLDAHPAWASRQGRSLIAFASMRGGNWDIYLMNADGSTMNRLTDGPGIEWRPTWAPVGRQAAAPQAQSNLIAFEGFVGEVSDIYLMDIEGGQPINFTQDAFRDTSPSFSPDGSKLAFASLRDGIWRIFIRDLPQRKGK